MGLWRKETAERKADQISFGVVQLVLDMLKTAYIESCIDDDFTLPAKIDTPSLEYFVSKIANGKVNGKKRFGEI